MEISTRHLTRYLFVGILFFSIVRFHFQAILPGVISHWWFDFALCLIIPAWLLFVREKITGGVREIYLLSSLVLPFLLLSVLMAEYPVNSILNYFKLLLYLLLILFFISLIRRSEGRVDSSLVLKVVDYSFLVIFVVAVIQLLDIPLFATFVKFIYGEDLLRSLWTGNPRIYATFRNANFFGVYLSFALAFWLNYFLYFNKKNRWLFWRFMPLIILIVASGSRTGLLASITVLLVSLFTYRFSVQRVAKYGIGAVVLIIASIGLANVLSGMYDLTRAFARFQVLHTIVTSEDLHADATLGERVELQLQAVSYITHKPLFGYGHRPNNLSPHNAYLTLILCFGIVGFSALTLFLILISYRILLSKNSSADARFFQKCYLVFTAGLLVAMMAGDFIFTSQVMLLWTAFAALSIAVEPHGRKQIVVKKRKKAAADVSPAGD